MAISHGHNSIPARDEFLFNMVFFSTHVISTALISMLNHLETTVLV